MDLTDLPSAPASPPRGILGWLRAWWSRLIAGLALATVAGVTGRISYLHIEALTLALHQPAQVAQIMPFGVDGLIVVGSVVLLQAAAGQEWLGWLCIGPGVAASLYANWESGIVHGRQSAFWATVPAVAFAVATFVFERWLKGQVGRGTSPGPATLAQPEAEEPSAGSGDSPAEVPGQLAPDVALQAFLASESDPVLALMLGVSRNKIRALRARQEAAGEAPGEAGAPDAEELAELATAAAGG